MLFIAKKKRIVVTQSSNILCYKLLFSKQFREQRIVGTLVMHCYMVPLRSRSTTYRLSRTSLLELSENVTTRQQHTVDLLRNLRSRYYKAYRLHQPSYLLDTLEPYVPCRGLRSVEMDLLTVPRSRTKIAERRFSSAAPTVWNRLSLSIRNTDSIVTFKSHLKTHLIRRNFLVE